MIESDLDDIIGGAVLAITVTLLGVFYSAYRLYANFFSGQMESILDIFGWISLIYMLLLVVNFFLYHLSTDLYIYEEVDYDEL
ncbi:hypothetical protein BCU68_10865 [Vibrio sp. 10N.286.49.B3]|uniref:hypothetical protein n=1 Tax=Vibrio sp. 10N.286.49.B3 TaxID=1880855 RepID=UPI000C84F102|nr:hypothetical protein [Vibrio sp. 10N.286.49.B3]PMH45357.1 hypothetical protein BCU68_10865 [Vibrio sp. 10N.286.49.B3]